MKVGKKADWRTYKCKQCGKKFDVLLDWAYKMRDGPKYMIMFCSWHCIQAYRREHPKRVYKWNKVPED